MTAAAPPKQEWHESLKTSYPWAVAVIVAAKYFVTPGILVMPYAVKDGGYVFSPIAYAVLTAIVIHGALILTALKYIQGKKTDDHEKIKFSQVCRRIGDIGGPRYLVAVGVYLGNMARHTEFLVHMFKCAIYIIVVAATIDHMQTVDPLDRDPATVRPLIASLAALGIFVAPFAQIPYISFALTSMASILFFAIMVCTYTMGTVDDDPDVTYKYGYTKTLALSIGQMAFVLSYFTPIMNTEFRAKDWTYIPPYLAGMIFQSMMSISYGVGGFLYYHEKTQNISVFNMDEGELKNIILILVIVANCLLFIPELRQGVKALDLNFSLWKNLKCFPYMPPIIVATFFHFILGFLIAFIALVIPSVELLCSFTGCLFVVLVGSMLPTLAFVITLLHLPFKNASLKMAYMVGNLAILITTTSCYVVLVAFNMMHLFTNYHLLTDEKIYR